MFRHGVVALLCALMGLTAFGTTSCKTAGFRRGYMALDSQGNRQRTQFWVDTESIYCVGEVTSGRADVTVHATIRSTARFDIPSRQMVPFNEVYAVGEAAPGKTDATVVAFLVPKVPAQGPTTDTSSTSVPYVAGEYACDLSIDGEDLTTMDFRVDYPACPAIPAVAGSSCTGWVLPNSNCPAAVLGQHCVCSPSTSLWECS